MNFDPDEVVHIMTILDVARTIESHIGKEDASTLSENVLSLAKEKAVAVLED